MSSLLKRKHLLAASKSGSLSYAATIVADGASNYWKLDEPSGLVAVDSIGSNNGTINGSVTLNQLGARANSASMLFNTNGKITTITTVSLLTPYTVEAWIKTTNTAQMSVVSTRNPGTNPILLGFSAGKLFLYYDNLGLSIAGTRVLNDGLWHQVVYIVSGTTVVAYVDGVVEPLSPSGLTTAGSSDHVVEIGQDTALSGSFIGFLQDVAIYPLILTPAQISTHYSFKSVPSALTYQQQVLADGATGYWPMNDVAVPIVDLAGGRNVTNPTGSPTFGVAGPRSLTAISFSRTASGPVPSAVPVPIGFTLEAWIRRTGVFPRAFIMARNLTAQNDWYWAFNTSSGDRIQFVYRDASVSNTVFFPMTFPLNTWTHVVLVMNGTNAQLYVNGVATGSSQALVTLGGAGSGPFQLASASAAPSEAWGGQLADLAIYPLVLTPAQILSHSVAL